MKHTFAVNLGPAKAASGILSGPSAFRPVFHEFAGRLPSRRGME
ncbi:hypothetical protein [Sulfitobacter sp. SH22]